MVGHTGELVAVGVTDGVVEADGEALGVGEGLGLGADTHVV